MKKNTLIIIGVIALVIIIGGILVARGGLAGSGNDVSITSFQTDKNLYHSKELMKLQIGISSGAYIENVTVHLWGITDRYGDTHMNKDFNLALSPGTTTIAYEYLLPNCSKCSGIDPGDYPINVKVSRDNAPIAIGKHTVRLEQ
jgi:hypothetical protein